MSARAFALSLLLALPAVALALPAAPPVVTPHVVIAVIDTGIDPYHEEFAAPALTQDPATWLSGYPSGAQRLDLCLDAHAHPGCASFAGAVGHDAATWSSVQPGQLAYIPGTRIVGAVSVGSSDDGFTGAHRILDDHGHGTATASLAAGRTLGLCPACLLVVVEGPGDDALRWASEQGWIDIVTNSWGLVANLDWPPPPLGADTAQRTKAMVERGQVVLFSAGNGFGNGLADPVTSEPDYLLPGESTYTSEYTGPDWLITVGAVDAQGQPVAGSARPVDLSAAGVDAVAATLSRSGEARFEGTSASAPIVAGAFGSTLLALRGALGDAHVGPRQGALAQGAAPLGTSPAAPIADGRLTRGELERVVLGTAQGCSVGTCALRFDGPHRIWGWTMPALPVASPLEVGWGTVDAGTRDAAVRVGLGQLPMPLRPDVAMWADADSAVRQQLWGNWDEGARWHDLLP
ncbi:MAG: S8/S53 family peptidase [Halobacteriales archaeon]|nr:S8/S53 family peptidase [Halobacteriales archaeon]